MRAFLSYRYGDEISAIRELLEEKEIQIFDSLSDIEVGSSLQQSIKTALLKCDFIICVYSEDNCNIAFEVGIAMGANKPIFSVLAGGNENLFLLDSTYVYAQPLEIDKIRFSFELFLINIKSTSSAVIKSIPPHKFYGGGEATPIKQYYDVIEKYNCLEYKSDESLTSFLMETLQAYGIKTIKNLNVNSESKLKFHPDFTIWYDYLSSLLRNPINVEVKANLNAVNLNAIIKDVSTNTIGSAVIFYDDLYNIEQKTLPFLHNVMFISIKDLVEELNHYGFAKSIQRIRNNIVHYK